MSSFGGHYKRIAETSRTPTKIDQIIVPHVHTKDRPIHGQLRTESAVPVATCRVVDGVAATEAACRSIGLEAVRNNYLRNHRSGLSWGDDRDDSGV
jgi:hypothetical protein